MSLAGYADIPANNSIRSRVRRFRPRHQSMWRRCLFAGHHPPIPMWCNKTSYMFITGLT